MPDRLKNIALPVLVAAILILALIFRLSSCSSQQRNDAADGTVSTTPLETAAASETPSSSNALFDLKDDNIRKVFKDAGYEVRAIRDTVSGGSGAENGSSDVENSTKSKIALVEFYDPNDSGAAPSRFAWVDRGSGAYDVVTDGLLADAYEVVPGNTLLVLTTGQELQSGRQWFPAIFSSHYTADPASPFTPHYVNEFSSYFMPAEKSFTVGNDRHESLESLDVSFSAVSAVFGPRQGFEKEFEPGSRSIPKTNVVCSGGYCYVTFYNTLPAPGFKAPKAGTGNDLQQFVSITSDGTNTLLTLKLGAKAQRYNIATDVSPDDGTSCAVLTFRSNSGVDYPSGW